MSNPARRTLGLPVPDVWAAWVASAVVLGVYMSTQYRDVSVWDSGLIATVAVEGGLGHPPGYPLHTWLGFLIARIPGVAPAVSLVWLSALPAAMMCIPALSLAARLAPGATGRVPAWLAALVIAAMSLHPSWWDPATRVEVYNLAAFLALWAVARFAAVLDGDVPARTAPASRVRPRDLILVGAAFGLSATAHPVVPALVAAGALPALVVALVRRRIGGQALGCALLGALLGLLPYLIIPLVARRQDALVWGAPATVAELWDFLRAADFAQKVGTGGSQLLAHVYDWVGWSAVSGTLVFLAVGAAGWATGGGGRGLGRAGGPLSAALAVLAIAANAVWFPENPDYLGYTAGPFTLCAAGGAALAARLWERAEGMRIAAAACALALLATGLLAPPVMPARTRARDHSARLLAGGALGEAPEGAVLLVEADHWVWPLLYLQEVEGLRPDVVVLPIGLASSSWFWERLGRRHPGLAPFELRGPGGREARVQRFLAAQTGRPRAFEHLGLAALAGSSLARVGYLLQAEARPDAPGEDAVTAAIAAMADVLKDGSPDGTGTLALASFMRGEALWRLGRPAAAYSAFLAGVPPSRRPPAPPADRLTAPAPPTPLPPALSLRGLGDPAINLMVADDLAAGR